MRLLAAQPACPPRRRWRRLAASAVGAAGLALALPLAPALASGALFPRAQEVSPPASANANPLTTAYAVTCTGNGACVGGGSYEDSSSHLQAWIASQSHGAWAQGVKLAMPKSAGAQPDAEINGIACVSAGNCYAVGYFYNTSDLERPFIAAETKGVWSRAFIPSSPVNASPSSQPGLEGVACTSTGYCEAIGGYLDKAGRYQAMAIAKPASKGWGQVVEILAPKDAAADPSTFLIGIACPSARNCVTVGEYDTPGTGIHEQAMGAVQVSGAWRRGVRIPLPADAKPNYKAWLNSIACRSGTCTAVGKYYYTDALGRAMYATESHGTFGAAKKITATPADADTFGPNTNLFGVSCPATGPCVAVGGYENSSGGFAALYMYQVSGQWQATTLLPPLDAKTGSAQGSIARAVSCTGAGHCTAVGYYTPVSGVDRAQAASTG